MIVDVEGGPSSGESSANQFNPTHSVGEELYSLLDKVDSESIANEFGIGRHCKKHDFDNHLKIGIFEGINPSDSLAEQEEVKSILFSPNSLAARSGCGI